jgi:hypothetical protein
VSKDKGEDIKIEAKVSTYLSKVMKDQDVGKITGRQTEEKDE